MWIAESLGFPRVRSESTDRSIALRRRTSTTTPTRSCIVLPMEYCRTVREDRIGTTGREATCSYLKLPSSWFEWRAVEACILLAGKTFCSIYRAPRETRTRQTSIRRKWAGRGDRLRCGRRGRNPRYHHLLDRLDVRYALNFHETGIIPALSSTRSSSPQKGKHNRTQQNGFNSSNVHTGGGQVTVDGARVVEGGNVEPAAALRPLDEMSREGMDGRRVDVLQHWRGR